MTYANSSFENNTLEDAGLTINIGISIISILLILMTVLANLGIIIAFWKIKSFGEKPSEFFILILACVDLFLGIIIIPNAPVSVYIWTGDIWRDWMPVLYVLGIRVYNKWPTTDLLYLLG